MGSCPRNKMSEVCLKALGEHLSKDKIPTQDDMMVGLQKARGAMQLAGGDECKALAPEEPLSVCGSQETPEKSRSWGRQDLFCEMVTWQWEELGDGNGEEFEANGCVFDESSKGTRGDSRKGGTL